MWHHYKTSGPASTLWDEWLSRSSLWPAGDLTNEMRDRWRSTLTSRRIDADGYVETHQHASIAHPGGWPFPFWAQSTDRGTWGWHFSLAGVPDGWHGTTVKSEKDWTLEGAKSLGIANDAWNIEITDPHAVVSTPPFAIDLYQAPYLQLRWGSKGLARAKLSVHVRTNDTLFDQDYQSRVEIDAADGDEIHKTMIPLARFAHIDNAFTENSEFRIVIDDAPPGATLGIQAIFTTYDTRHDVNNQNFILGCCNYFDWTGDTPFLRANIVKMRRAMQFLQKDLHGLVEKGILCDWTGHDGRAGIVLRPSEGKKLRPGHGIGSNYWDLLPIGYEDPYATIYYYRALIALARIEFDIYRHPEWSVAREGEYDSSTLTEHAFEVAKHFKQRFISDDTKRVVATIDAAAFPHDYGLTFLNLEAVESGILDAASPEAKNILDWISGRRVVESDTSKGDDIYHWRFGPRSTTKRNVEWYGWYWSAPESIPFGGQVQDGGAVLGFSYYDILSRLKVYGPDDAWNRLREICHWYEDVESAGGYREYYKNHPGGATLQGGGTAGGLGLDVEFVESALLPQVMLYGFLGLRFERDGIVLDPKLPSEWSSLRVTGIRYQSYTLVVTVTKTKVYVSWTGPKTEAPSISLKKAIVHRFHAPESVDSHVIELNR